MGMYKALAIDEHNRQMAGTYLKPEQVTSMTEYNRQMSEILAEYRESTNTTPYPPPDALTSAKQQIENALSELEAFRQGPGTFENYEYVHLNLCLALHNIERTAR